MGVCVGGGVGGGGWGVGGAQVNECGWGSDPGAVCEKGLSSPV